MKKFIYLMPILLLCLTGCGEKKGQLECTLSSNDVINGYQLDSNYIINYKGEYVDTIESTETVTTDSEQLREYFENYFDESYSKTNAAYGGYTYNIEISGNKVESKVKVDYNKMDIKKFVDDQPTLKTYIKNNKMLLSGIKSLYEGMGITCK